MQDVFIMCEWTHTTTFAKHLREQLRDLAPTVEVLTHGMTSKQGIGFILLTWRGIVPNTFIGQLVNNHTVLDFAVYDISEPLDAI